MQVTQPMHGEHGAVPKKTKTMIEEMRAKWCIGAKQQSGRGASSHVMCPSLSVRQPKLPFLMSS